MRCEISTNPDVTQINNTPLPMRHPPQAGPFRRAIALRRVDARQSFGRVEDDFHHFGVTIAHRAGVIESVRTTTRRAPWSTCAAAMLPLRALEGQRLRERASDVGAMIDMRSQCTHMFDLAGLVMAAAARDIAARDYLAEVPGRPIVFTDGFARNVGATVATLRRDGERVLAWQLENNRIVGPEGGQSLDRGFRAWTEAMEIDAAEQAFVLRRAIMVSTGRNIDLDRVETAADAPLPPVCHTFRGTLTAALRQHGSTRDFGTDMSQLLTHPDALP